MKYSLAISTLILIIILAAGAAFAAPDLMQRNGAFKLSDRINIISSPESLEESVQDPIASPDQIRMPSDKTMDSIGDEFQRATKCAAFLRDFADFLASASPGVPRRVSFTAVSNRYDGLATYTSGWMYYDGYADTLVGDARQYSNRYTDYPHPSQPICPFGQQTNTMLKISIDVSNGMTTITQKIENPQDKKTAPMNPEVLVENTWNAAMQCENGVLYGFTDASPPEMFAISLSKVDG